MLSASLNKTFPSFNTVSISVDVNHAGRINSRWNVLFNDALNTLFYGYMASNIW